MRRGNLPTSLVTLMAVFFFTGIVTFSQVQHDTTKYSFEWKPEALLGEPRKIEHNRNENFQIMVPFNQLRSIFNKVFKTYALNPDEWYSPTRLSEIYSGILQSDEVIISKQTENKLEIKYGNYQNRGFGFRSVGVYNHLFIDMNTGRILPEFYMSFTY